MFEFYKYITSSIVQFLIFIGTFGISLFIIQVLTLSFVKGILSEVFSYQFALVDKINKIKYEK